MPPQPLLVYCSVAGIIITFGLTVSIFFMVVNIIHWSKRRHVKPCDKLFATLAFFRCLHYVSMIFIAATLFGQLHEFVMGPIKFVFTVAFLLMDFSSLWIATWLCFLYFINITMFQHPLVWTLRLRVPSLMPLMVTGSTFLSFVFSVVISWNINDPSTALNYFSVNISEGNRLGSIVASYIVVRLLPFLVLSVLSCILLYKLTEHVRQTKHRFAGYARPQANVLFMAIRSLVLLVLICLCQLVANVITAFYWSSVHVTSIMVLVCFVCPVCHTVIVIQGNSKIRRTLVNLLQCFQIKEDLRRKDVLPQTIS